MELIENRKFEQLLFLGDIHGNFNLIRYYINSKKLKNTIIFQVGDFGIGFKPKNETHVLNQLNRQLKENNIIVYAIRGNHDDPSFFDNRWITENICLLQDWTILQLNIDDKIERIFCFGGAISIDRLPRQKDKAGWWPGELCNFNEALIDDVKDISIVVTHTAPEWCQPHFFNDFVYSFAAYDAHLMDDLKKERKELAYMFDRIYKNNQDTLRKHYYGHFHFNATGEYKGVINKLLDVDELCSSSY